MYRTIVVSCLLSTAILFLAPATRVANAATVGSAAAPKIGNPSAANGSTPNAPLTAQDIARLRSHAPGMGLPGMWRHGSLAGRGGAEEAGIPFVVRKYRNAAADLSYDPVIVQMRDGNFNPVDADLVNGALFAVVRDDQTDPAAYALLDDKIQIFSNHVPGALELRPEEPSKQNTDLGRPWQFTDALGQPIAGAEVAIETDPPFALMRSATTDARGEIRFANVVIMNLAVRVVDVRLKHPEYGEAATFGVAQLTRAGSPERAAAAKGIVRDASGAPVAGAAVFVTTESNPLAFYYWEQPGDRIFTNERGEFAWHPVQRWLTLSPEQLAASFVPGPEGPIGERSARVRIVPPAGRDIAIVERTIVVGEAAVTPAEFVLPAGARNHTLAFLDENDQPQPITKSYAVGYYPPGAKPAMTLADPGIVLPGEFLRSGGPLADGVYWAFRPGSAYSDYAALSVGRDSPEALAFEWATKNITIRARAVDAQTGQPVPYALLFIGEPSNESRAFNLSNSIFYEPGSKSFGSFPSDEPWIRAWHEAQTAATKSPKRLPREPPEGQRIMSAYWHFDYEQVFIAGPDGVFEALADPGKGDRMLMFQDYDWLATCVKLDQYALRKDAVLDLGDVPVLASAAPVFILDIDGAAATAPLPFQYETRWIAKNPPARMPVVTEAVSNVPYGVPFLFNRMQLLPGVEQWEAIPASLPVQIEFTYGEPRNTQSPGDTPRETYLDPQFFQLPMGPSDTKIRIALPPPRKNANKNQ